MVILALGRMNRRGRLVGVAQTLQCAEFFVHAFDLPPMTRMRLALEMMPEACADKPVGKCHPLWRR